MFEVSDFITVKNIKGGVRELSPAQTDTSITMARLSNASIMT